MSSSQTDQKIFTKVVMFGGQKMTLFSLDGNTWSSRKVELSTIQQRQEQQRMELAGKKEDEDEFTKPVTPSRKYDEEARYDDPEAVAEAEEEAESVSEAAPPKKLKLKKPVLKIAARPVLVSKPKTAAAKVPAKKQEPKRQKTAAKKVIKSQAKKAVGKKKKAAPLKRRKAA